MSKRSLARLSGVDPLLIAIVVDAVRDCPHDFGIPMHGGKRTAHEQNQLFIDGKSQLDGYNKRSYHQSGKAFDIFGYVNGRATWDKTILTEIAKHIKYVALEKYGVQLTWGGDWKNFVDMPHFQI